MPISLIKKVWSLLSGSGLIWKVLRNFKVLSDSFGGIETVLNNMTVEKRKLPTHAEIEMIARAVSNILKTGVIDFPGVDEYAIAVNIDEMTATYAVSIQDAKSDKYIQLPIIKKL